MEDTGIDSEECAAKSNPEYKANIDVDSSRHPEILAGVFASKRLS
jgi:hypothetical protein